MENLNFLVGNQGIKWAHDGKEGVIALTAPDSEEMTFCDDRDCQLCAYHSVCLQNKIIKDN
jgi:hypothetical protein